jgi:PKD repeat protein
LTAINACGSTFIENKKKIKVNSMGVPPVVNFTANNITINAGQFVNFTDLSVNSPNTWNWTFSGGNPANSNSQNPANIQYNTPGYYDVSLTATNAFGSNNLTKTGYIHVLAAAPTMVFIKKITLKQMNFPVNPPYYVNVYYKISDVPPLTGLYLNGIGQIINSVIQPSLPVFWNLTPSFQLPVMNHMYQISFRDKKTMPPMDNLIGSVQFNPSTLTAYPSIITLSQNGINADIELQWQ